MPAGNTVRPLVGLLVSLDIEWCPPDDLERHQVRVHRMGVPGEVDIDPVLYRTPFGGFRRVLAEMDPVEVQEPGGASMSISFSVM